MGRKTLLRADAAVQAGKLPEAAELYRSALKSVRDPERRLVEAFCLRGLASCQAGEGALSEALTTATQAVQMFQECRELSEDDRASSGERLEFQAYEGEAITLTLIADFYSKLGRETESLESLERAKALFGNLKGRDAPASVWMATARAAMRNGQVKEAERHMRKALQIFKSENDRRGEVATLLQMADLHRMQLKLHKAEEALNLARSIVARMDEEPSLVGRVWVALGSLHLQGMRLEKACAAYQRALALVRQTNNEEKVGTCLIGLGEVESRSGDPKAMGTLLEGVTLLVRLNQRGAVISALLRIGEHGLRVGVPRLAFLVSEGARRMAKQDSQVSGQGHAMRLVVKSLAAMRESRATLIAALAREAVAGSVQKNAVDVAQFYRRRAPKQLIAELDALSAVEKLSQLERLTNRILLPVVSSVEGSVQDVGKMSTLLELVVRYSSEETPSSADLFTDELTYEEESDEFSPCIDSEDDPPTDAPTTFMNEVGGESALDLPVATPAGVSEGAPPVRPRRSVDGNPEVLESTSAEDPQVPQG